VIQYQTLLAWLDAATSDAAIVEELEAQAVAHVERVTGRYFGPVREVTEILRGNGSARLWLAETPIDGVTVAEAARVGDEPGDMDAAAFALRVSGNEAALERRGGKVWDAGAEYHVTYSHGYEDGEEPADVRRAVMAWVSRQWVMRGKEGLQSEQIGGYSYTTARDQGDTSDVDALLAPWVRTVVA
jgi:hypothetical protein